jgi:hypothetical protein
MSSAARSELSAFRDAPTIATLRRVGKIAREIAIALMRDPRGL